MPGLLAATEYGGYISLVKLAILSVSFLAWIPLVKWIYTDSDAVGTKVNKWTGTITATGAVSLLVWLFVPVFAIGLLFYLIAVGAVSMAYVMHRNTRVSDSERVLTASHVMGLFAGRGKKKKVTAGDISFITANGNEAPLPEPRTPEAAGYKMSGQIFKDCLWRRASDVVFRPEGQNYSVTYYIDGVATKQPPRPKEEIEALIRYLKQLADLDIDERRKPQTGAFKLVRDSERIEWEVTTAGSTAGEKGRIVKLQEYSLMKMDDLGLAPKQLELMLPMRNVERGLFIISGPEKSGITSTLYSMLCNHDPFMNNINTLEKTFSTELPNVTQHRFSLSDTGTTTYSRKLQTILRMGPDIVGIADCKDAQTAKLACAAVKDNKVVYITIKATSVVQALGKWLKLVSDKDLVTETLAGIVNQRLFRQLCEECRQAYQPNQELLRKFNIPADKVKVLYRPGEPEHNKHGHPVLCENCQGTGFHGRSGVFETVVMNDKLKGEIKKAKSLQEMASHFRRAGMLYMQEQAIKKVAKGTTSINEIIRQLSQDQKQAKPKAK